MACVPLLSVLAGVTIVAGNLMAIPQQNVKRLLGYSGVAHIGYMLIGLAAMSADGVAMVLFYLLAMRLFRLSLGGIPFVAGFWASCTCSSRASTAG